MRVEFKIEGDFKAIIEQSVKAGAKAVKQTMLEASAALQEDLRTDVRSAGLGDRLANAVRKRVFPDGQDSLGAAAYVYAQPSKSGRGGAAAILSAFEQGATISAKRSRFLAIPTAAVPTTSGGRPMTVDEFTQKYGRDRLVIIPRRKGRGWLLLMRLAKSRTGSLSKRKLKKGSSAGSLTLFFVLIPTVTIAKRIDWRTRGESIADRLPNIIISKWEANGG